mmetsp:Transcript_6642/g.28334  ORF Transcript_6642/g.28334 Transcript_6642/m.28334 type:complete len:297 (-) Transcript_6642:2156-3046(-)
MTLVLLGHHAHDHAERLPRGLHDVIVLVAENRKQRLDQSRHVVLLVEARRLRRERPAQRRRRRADARFRVPDAGEHLREEQVVRVGRDGAQDRGCRASRGVRLLGGLAGHRGEQRREQRLEVRRERRARHLGERAERLRSVRVDGGSGQRREHGREDLGLRLEHLLQTLQRGVVRPELREQSWHDGGGGFGAAVTERRVEGGARRVANRRVGVAQRVADGGHDVSVQELLQLLLARGGEHLRESEADALPGLRAAAGIQPVAQDGENLGQHALAEFPHELAQTLPRGLPAVLGFRA